MLDHVTVIDYMSRLHPEYAAEMGEGYRLAEWPCDPGCWWDSAYFMDDLDEMEVWEWACDMAERDRLNPQVSKDAELQWKELEKKL